MWKHGDRPVTAPPMQKPRYSPSFLLAAIAAGVASFFPQTPAPDAKPPRQRRHGRYVLQMGSARTWGVSRAGATCCDSKRSRRRHRHADGGMHACLSHPMV